MEDFLRHNHKVISRLLGQKSSKTPDRFFFSVETYWIKNSSVHLGYHFFVVTHSGEAPIPTPSVLPPWTRTLPGCRKKDSYFLHIINYKLFFWFCQIFFRFISNFFRKVLFFCNDTFFVLFRMSKVFNFSLMIENWIEL